MMIPVPIEIGLILPPHMIRPGPLEIGVLSVLFAIVIPLVFVILIIWFWKRRPRGQSPEQNKDDKYLDIAKERYAKGEINSAEWEKIKKDLS